MPECIGWTGPDMGCIAENVAGSGVEKLVTAMAEGLQTALQYVSSFWMEVPSPTLAEGAGQSWSGAPAITSMQGYLMPVTAAFCVISFSLALARIGFSPERAHEGLRGIGRQLVAVVVATLPALAVAQLLLEAGDEFSPWILTKGAGMGSSEGFEDVLIAGMVGTGTPAGGTGLFLVVFLLGLLGSIVQCVFMVIRSGAIIVLFVLLPVVAAGAATEEGWLRLKRMAMLILGFVLYKPVAAIIYATGLRLMADTQSAGDQVQNALYGLTVITMAAVALPAFIKFVMPIAAAGSSSAFSGGAAVGAVAAGAAVVTLGGGAAAAGAGARGAGGASAGGAASGAAMTGATTAEGAAEAAGGLGGAGGGSGGAGGASPSGSGGSAGGSSGGSSRAGGGRATGGRSGPGGSSTGSNGGAADGAASGPAAGVSEGTTAGDNAAAASGADSGGSSTSSATPGPASAGAAEGGSSSSNGSASGGTESPGSGSAAAAPGAEAGPVSQPASGSDGGGGRESAAPVAGGASAEPPAPGARPGPSTGRQATVETAKRVADRVAGAGDDAAEGAEQR